MRGREKFKKAKWFINIVSKVFGFLPRSIKVKLFESFRGMKGNKGIVFRYALLKTLAKYVGDNVSIHSDVYIRHIERLKVKDNVSIHPFCYIDCLGTVTIENDVSIAEGVSFFSFNHKFSDLSKPIKDQGVVYQPIVIESDVWIGAKATILGDVTIASGTVIGAGAVVTRSTDKNDVVAGVPAKRIGKRSIIE